MRLSRPLFSQRNDPNQEPWDLTSTSDSSFEIESFSNTSVSKGIPETNLFSPRSGLVLPQSFGYVFNVVFSSKKISYLLFFI